MLRKQGGGTIPKDHLPIKSWRVIMVDKLREVIRNIQNTILTSAMPLKYKIAFFVTLPFSPITKKVYWFGRPFLTDNRLGCFLLPGYIIEILNLKKEQFNLRFQRATGQLENTSRIRVVRRDIARAKTLVAKKRHVSK